MGRLSGDPEDIYKTDRKVKRCPRTHLHRWLDLARERCIPRPPCTDLLARTRRTTPAGLAFNEMVASGELERRLSSAAIISIPDRWRAPIARLKRCWTDPMRYPIGRCECALNTAGGATWVSFLRRRCRVGYAQHAGVVIICDGTVPQTDRACVVERSGFAMRHADAGYEKAIEMARRKGSSCR